MVYDHRMGMPGDAKGLAETRLVPLGELKPAPWNPRSATDAHFASLKRRMSGDPDFMWDRPVLARAGGEIYAGNLRWRAAESLGWAAIPARISAISEERAKDRSIGDNVHAGEWHYDELSELAHAITGGEEGAMRDLLMEDALLRRAFEEPETVVGSREVDMAVLEAGLGSECPRCHFRF